MSRLSGFEGYSGDQWQELCLRVLHVHHPGPELIDIPDADRGDAGLEAVALSGAAYQCYAPENEPLSATQRYNKHRDKMTEDIGKFIQNSEKIQAMLPAGLEITHWVLLVPTISTRRLLEHAARKTAEVRTACLPYATDNIIVTANTLSSYEPARSTVISQQLSKLELPPLPDFDYDELDDPQILVVKEKLGKTTQYADERRRSKLVERLLENHLAGRSHRDFIRDQYSELGDELESQLEDLEARLEVQYPLDEPNPDKLLASVLRDTESAVTNVLNARKTHCRVIAEGQVADWLMRCPLDFP